MLTLYHSPATRSSRFIFLLEEIGAPYGIEYVTIKRQDGSGGRDPKNVHPEGKVPALVHDGALVTESAAIALYLSDLVPAAKVGPAVGDPQRGEYVTELARYAGVFEPLVTAKFSGQLETNTALAESYQAMIDAISKRLESGPWWLGEAFSTADILYGSAATYFRGLLPEGAAVDAYIERIKARPAYQRALAKDAVPA